MSGKKKFIDLREQKSATDEAAAKRVRKRIAYTLIVFMLVGIAFACACGINGGSIQIAELSLTTRGCISTATILGIASFIAYKGGIKK